jgi:hypothetical protein
MGNLETLIDDIYNHNVTPFIGAGVNGNSVCKWAELVNKMIKECNLIVTPELEEIKNISQEEFYKKAISKCIEKDKAKCEECLSKELSLTPFGTVEIQTIYSIIMELKCNNIITTNFDEFLRGKLASEKLNIYYYPDKLWFSNLTGSKNLFFVHGIFAKDLNMDISKLVLDYDSFGNAYGIKNDSGIVKDFLMFYFTYNSIFFIGLNHLENNILAILSEVCKRKKLSLQTDKKIYVFYPEYRFKKLSTSLDPGVIKEIEVEERKCSDETKNHITKIKDYGLIGIKIQVDVTYELAPKLKFNRDWKNLVEILSEISGQVGLKYLEKQRMTKTWLSEPVSSAGGII